MGRVVGPDPVGRTVFGGSRGYAGRWMYVYADEGLTTLADVRVFDPNNAAVVGSAIPGSRVTLGAGGRVPQFWYPDGATAVWGRVARGGPVVALTAATSAAGTPAGITLNRPDPVGITPGTVWLDQVTGVPQWADGAVWRNAAGIVVPPIGAPVTAPVVGTEVGVPAGTVLTATTGIPTADTTTQLLLVHPLTGVFTIRSAPTFRRRRWTATINPHPPVGVTWLFDECEFDVAADNFCVDLNDDRGVADLMQPVAVFRNCTFDGNSTTGKCLVGGFLWLVNSALGGAEDGWAGLYWSVAVGSRIVAGTDGQPDPHADAIQMSGLGHSVVYRCWLDAGQDSATANAPLRVGTEFSAVTDVQVFYTGFAGSQHGAQFRGDAGSGDITSVVFQGNRWVDEQIYGPTDFAETSGVTWVDNAFMDGTTIPNPAP